MTTFATSRRSAAIGAALLIISLCVVPQVWAQAQAADLPGGQASPAARDYVLAPGDAIAVKFLYNPELNEQMPIRPDGKIALPIVGEVMAAGLSPEQLRTHLTAQYAPVVKKPEISVIVQSFSALKVFVGGEVGRPGELAYIPGMTTLQAVIMAGGDRRTASTRNVVIVRDQGTETPQFLLVDLKQVVNKSGPSNDVRLQPRDIVFVPTSRIAKVNLFIQQYIKDVIPMSMTLGLYYNFAAFVQQ